jgi:radical SAM superfamily enzyme YgiQ (UPF0313 family)
MRIVLAYPPPWKIPTAGGPADERDGPPADFAPGDLDADFHQTPYGLFTLAAQALAAGHQVKVVNLSAFAWSDVERFVASIPIDVFGMSCWTANRRGVALVADCVRRHHRGAHIIIGGPHATPLAHEMLAHHAAIDSVALGEAETTFLELLQRLETGQSLAGLAGAVVRNGSVVEQGPPRPPIAPLDSLACPHEHFATHVVMTSRGCPFNCTFCGAETTWGRGFRGHSVPYVLDMIEQALDQLPVRMLQIKDDTFTANRRRVFEICRGIRDRDLRMLWSCDTRVDVLSEELLRQMRLAGCERLSLGVESGSPTVLRRINKKITVDQILESTEMAKRVGIQVRYYMMLGNRGETAETFRESVAFVERARPHQALFSCLSIYPGTQDYHDAIAAGRIRVQDYFRGRLLELKMPFDATAQDERLMNDWFAANSGLLRFYRPSVHDCRAVLERLGDHPPAHLDLAGALLQAGSLDTAAHHAELALKLGHPTPGVVRNLLACIRYRQGDLEKMKDELVQAGRTDPQHPVLLRNAQAVRTWLARGCPASAPPLDLDPSHDFQLLERTAQPTLPGPLGVDSSHWS